MGQTVDVILGIVIFCAAAPLFILLHFSPHPWRVTLRIYQSVIGSLVTLFTAGIAFVGVWITMSVQSTNIERQLKAQRETEDRAASAHLRQVASAFVGEIAVIKAVFGPDWRTTAENALAELQHEEKEKPTLT